MNRRLNCYPKKCDVQHRVMYGIQVFEMHTYTHVLMFETIQKW